jgi:hypothetical protein
MPLAGRLGSLDAGFQGGHHVDDFRLLIGNRRELELLPGRLLGDQVERLDSVVVLVLVGVELGRQRPNQYFRQKLLPGGS